MDKVRWGIMSTADIGAEDHPDRLGQGHYASGDKADYQNGGDR